MILTYVTIAFIAICSINCLYQLLLLPFTFKRSTVDISSKSEAISVLIYVKNDAAILAEFLERIQQLTNFSQHQFVFVNHASYDTSEEILEIFSLKYPNTLLVNVENKESFWGSKRYALTLGIKQCTHEKLAFISPNTFFEQMAWLEKMGAYLNYNTTMGYNGFTKEKGGLNKVIRFYNLLQETFHLGFGSLGISGVFNDTNLGYTKTLFFENKGFNSRIHEYAGVQSLFYSDVASTKKATFAKDIVLRQAFSWQNWKTLQAYRYATFTKSTFLTKLLYILFQLSQYAFWPLFIASCFVSPLPLLITFAGIKLILSAIIVVKNGIDFNEKDVLYFYPFIEFISLGLGIYLFLNHLFTKKK